MEFNGTCRLSEIERPVIEMTRRAIMTRYHNKIRILKLVYHGLRIVEDYWRKW